MSFLDYLEQVRARPEPARKRLLFIWTILGTLIIVGLWLFNMWWLMPGADTTEILVQQESVTGIKASIKDSIDQFRLGLDLIIETIRGIF